MRLPGCRLHHGAPGPARRGHEPVVRRLQGNTRAHRPRDWWARGGIRVGNRQQRPAPAFGRGGGHGHPGIVPESWAGRSTPALRCADERAGAVSAAHPVPARAAAPRIAGHLRTDLGHHRRHPTQGPVVHRGRGPRGNGTVPDPRPRVGGGTTGAGRPTPRGRPVRFGAVTPWTLMSTATRTAPARSLPWPTGSG